MMMRLLLGSGGAVNVVPVPLRRNDPTSPWCYAASLTPPISFDDDDEKGHPADDAIAPSSATPMLPPGSNFLATQVWPSSRIAAAVVERHADPSWTVCELGCGPGLPSLTTAGSGARRVIATDVDELALELVRAAAAEQGFANDRSNDEREEERFVTKQFDLTCRRHPLPEADLYILSDVFESESVANGAAWHVQSLLSNNQKMENGDTSRVWVFAQSDRAQRDCFLREMKDFLGEDGDCRRCLGWSMDHVPDRDEELWLFDLDETMVEYN